MRKYLPWGVFAAAVIAALTAALFLLADLSTKDRSYVESAAEAAQDHRARADRQRTACLAGPAPAQCVEAAEQAAEKQGREEYDLAAQWTAAWWAKVMGWIAVFGTLFNAIGIGLLFSTFRQTLEQAGEFQKSLAESKRTADAMERVAESMAVNAEKIVVSVQHQEAFGKMQMRAYVSVIIGRGRYQDKYFVFEAGPQLVNTGHTPAKNLRWRIMVDVLPNPLPKDFRFPAPKGTFGGLDLPPHQNGFMRAVHNMRFDDKQAEAIRLGIHTSLYVWGVVRYRDAFGDRHHTSFAQRIWWEPGADEKGELVWRLEGEYLDRHNRST